MWIKKCLFLAFVLMNLNGFGQTEGYRIEVVMEGLEDTVVYLGNHFGPKKYLQDTAKLGAGGRLVFEGDRRLKTGMYFLYGGALYMDLIIDEQQFKLSTKRTDLYGSMIVEDSPSNVQFRDFQELMIAHQQNVRDLTQRLDSTSTKKDSVTIFDQVQELNDLNLAARDSLQEQCGDSFVAELIELMGLRADFAFEGDSLTVEEKQEQYNAFKNDYFKNIDFNSEGLVRTPIFESKINEYLDKVTIQNPDSVIHSVDFLLNSSQDNEELYRYLLVTLFQKYQNHKIMGMDKVFVYLSDEYYLKGKAPWADEAMITELKKEMVFHRDNQIGNIAPQIYFQDTSGVASSLYSIKDDYIILYFYSPTCGHCKKKTPVLKEVYDQLDGKAEVVAVCTDTDAEKWKEFIQELDLNWLNYADMGYKSNFRVEYNVRSTPMLYILDKDKRIIAKKLDVEQVKGFVEEQVRRALQ